jgi:hypothetical protein
LGIGFEQRKLLPWDGVEDGELSSFLYVVKFAFVCRGETCGELYRAMIMRPKEKRSAAEETFESRAKSGEV